MSEAADRMGNVPALVGWRQEIAAQLQTAAQYPGWPPAHRRPGWGVQRAQDQERNGAAGGLLIAVGQPFWVWGADAEGVTHTGLAACAGVALALLGRAGSHWGLVE